jgi:hypothetical protein
VAIVGLVTSMHMLFADRKGTPPEAGAVHKVVTTVIAGVVRQVLGPRG